jgi:hypothetical protein
MAGVGRRLAEAAARPRSRAFGAGYLATAIALQKRRVPLVLAVALCYAGGFAARKAWQLAEDVHAIAQSSQEIAADQPPQGPPEGGF